MKFEARKGQLRTNGIARKCCSPADRNATQCNAAPHHAIYHAMCYKRYVRLGKRKGPCSISDFARAAQTALAHRNVVPRYTTPCHATTFGAVRYALNRNVKFGARKGPFGISDFARRCCSQVDRNTTPRSAISCNTVRCVLDVAYVWRRGKARAASAAVAAACSITSYRGHATQHRTMLSDAARRPSFNATCDSERGKVSWE